MWYQGIEIFSSPTQPPIDLPPNDHLWSPRIPGRVAFDHLGTVFCLIPEELIEHPVLAQRLDPLLALAPLVLGALPGGEGGGQGEEGEDEAECCEPHDVTGQVTRD